MKKAVLRARFSDVKEYQENLEKEEVKEEKPKKRGRKKND